MDGRMNSSLDEDRAVRATLNAFWSAREAGEPPAACYRAAVEVWRWLHPDQAPADAAQRAVTLILDTRQAALRRMCDAMADA
jgi:hypothetical protein